MPKTVDDYLAAQPPATRRLLKRVRTVIRKTLGKQTEEVISYGIPAYRQHDRVVVYVAGWKDHISMYPITKPLEAVLKTKKIDAKKQLSGRGTVRFPLDAPLPVHLISTIAAFRSREVAEKAKARKRPSGPRSGAAKRFGARRRGLSGPDRKQ